MKNNLLSLTINNANMFLVFQYQISHQDLIHGNAKKKLQEAVYDISSVAHQHLVMVSVIYTLR